MQGSIRANAGWFVCRFLRALTRAWEEHSIFDQDSLMTRSGQTKFANSVTDFGNPRRKYPRPALNTRRPARLELIRPLHHARRSPHQPPMHSLLPPDLHVVQSLPICLVLHARTSQQRTLPRIYPPAPVDASIPNLGLAAPSQRVCSRPERFSAAELRHEYDRDPASRRAAVYHCLRHSLCARRRSVLYRCTD